ncbi:polymer-forming cytoskeletal-domain-containing protein [Tribonema minus]|uniref:Polymer-forming cytoskeletal-domain-containing protein n=1 Tax=Tribonema minus TaxID=303371 RepID=A0A835YKE5_9STRA|nr:polymer-forming cytoskeletal-domain-containing protein [Tribonema minus]
MTQGAIRAVKQSASNSTTWCKTVTSFQSETPETTIGERVSVSGELSFDRLLRIDGRFSGRLLSQGDLVVGPTGVLTGDVVDMGEVIVDGKVVGDISVQKVSLRGRAEVHGNITCKSLCVDPTVIVVGGLNVHPGERCCRPLSL